MTHLYQNKNMKTLVVFPFKESARPDGVRRLHKVHIWYFGLQFSSIGYWGYPSKANNRMLGYSIAKSDTANIFKKPHNFVKKLISTKLSWSWNYMQISQGRKGRKKGSWICECFLLKSKYHSIYFRKLFQF